MSTPYTPQRALSHRQHSPTRATTQEFFVFIRHPEPQLKICHFESQLKECHVLNPYPEPQLKGYVPSHNSRNTTHTSRQVQHASRPPGGGHVPPSATRLKTHCLYNYLLAGQPSSLGATRPVPLYFCNFPLAVQITPLVAIPVQRAHWICTNLHSLPTLVLP